MPSQLPPIPQDPYYWPSLDRYRTEKSMVKRYLALKKMVGMHKWREVLPCEATFGRQRLRQHNEMRMLRIKRAMEMVHVSRPKAVPTRRSQINLYECSLRLRYQLLRVYDMDKDDRRSGIEMLKRVDQEWRDALGADD